MTVGENAKLLERLDAGANHRDYPEAFSESWTTLAADAASAIRRLEREALTAEQELKLARSQLAECHKEIFKLRESLVPACTPVRSS